VAIVGILAAIAYPTYQGQMFKARRTEGQALLLDVAGRQEQYFANNKTFTDDMEKLGYQTNPALSENGYYSVATAAGPTNDLATSFLATATRLGSQTRDSVCYDFTVDSTGRRSMANYPGFDAEEPADPPDGCW
jgi:type IV pilus assembly protein PilE